jgi:hypothetical protein
MMPELHWREDFPPAFRDPVRKKVSAPAITTLSA